jgi:ribose transport system permease protein
LTQDNILTVAHDFSFVGIAALGGAMVIMTRGIDLSVGANMALSGYVTAEVLSHGMPGVPAVTLGLAVGLSIGIANGALITLVGLQPFIATLGMMSVARGVVLVRSQGFPLYPPASFLALGQGKLGPVPIPVVLMLGLTAVLTIFLSSTALGRHVYAVGGNESATRLLGIRVRLVKIIVYGLAGVLGAAGGIVLMASLGTAAPGAATGSELDVIAACVIGGVSLSGGEGNLIGVILGAALLEEIRNGLVLENVPGFWEQLVTGLLILSAMAVDRLRQRDRPD